MNTRCGGFTLVELVVVIVVSAIVVGFAVMFMSAPVDAYYSQSRRSELVESSDAIKRTLSADLRRALPNSVRIRLAGARAIVELLVADEVAFYRTSGTVGDDTRELDFGSVDTLFASIGQFAQGPSRPFDLPANRHLVVNNLGTAGSSAYQMTNVITPAGTQIRLEDGGTPGEDRIRLTPGFNFTTPSPTSRIFLVSGPIAYICNSAANARTLRRYENYSITAGIPVSEASPQLNAGGVQNTIVARDVTACNLRCENGTTPPCQTALVVDMSVSRTASGGNEIIRVFAQLPVENTP